MKLSYIIPIAACLVGMASCGKDDGPKADKQLIIAQQYMPVSMTFDSTDEAIMQKCRDWNRKVVVVNSNDQLPDDPIGFSASFQHLNLQYQTLLLAYRMQVWNVESYTNTFIRSYSENCYKWTVSTGICDFFDEEDTTRNFTRYAILISKIPDGADVKMYWNESISGWDWDWD